MRPNPGFMENRAILEEILANVIFYNSNLSCLPLRTLLTFGHCGVKMGTHNVELLYPILVSQSHISHPGQHNQRSSLRGKYLRRGSTGKKWCNSKNVTDWVSGARPENQTVDVTVQVSFWWVFKRLICPYENEHLPDETRTKVNAHAVEIWPWPFSYLRLNLTANSHRMGPLGSRSRDKLLRP